MTPEDPWEPTSPASDGADILAEIAALHAHDVSPERAERIRLRATALLAARRKHVVSSAALVRAWREQLEPVAAVAVCVVYLVVAVVMAAPFIR